MTQCTPQDLKTVYGLLMRELDRLRKGEFTDEELRADQAFAIFLMQCANLINKIQLKMITHSPTFGGKHADRGHLSER